MQNGENNFTDVHTQDSQETVLGMEYRTTTARNTDGWQITDFCSARELVDNREGWTGGVSTRMKWTQRLSKQRTLASDCELLVYMEASTVIELKLQNFAVCNFWFSLRVFWLFLMWVEIKNGDNDKMRRSKRMRFN